MRTTTVVIGAGHAGLAMSRRLTERSIDHVVLERGEVANSWLTERWDSLRLLTPNWQTCLPAMPYAGFDPDGFMTMPAVARLIREYAQLVAAPIVTRTPVTKVAPERDRYVVTTDRGDWSCATVVVASGPANVCRVPAVASAVPPDVAMVTPMTYRRADDLRPGGVLVVGASATGVQLADEIHRSGRPVTLAVGEHVRLPRRYRGRDIFWWMDAAGVLDERDDEVDDLARARRLPSPQLVGDTEGRSLDLNALSDLGVRIVGRLAGVADGSALFSGSVANVTALADLKMNRLLGRFDDWAAATGVDAIGPPERPAPTRVPARPTLQLRLGGGEVDTVVWATGYRPDYSWLDLPVLDRTGHIRHRGGVVSDAPGVYLLGASLLRRRRSSYISGADGDTEALASELHGHLDRRHRSGDAGGRAVSSVGPI